MFTSEERERYEPHFELPGFGIEGQMKLKQAKVLVIGAGGLGCPALQYLSAAGIGMLGLADGASVKLSDLQRQVLYGIEDLGKNKAEVATLRLKKLNNNILYNCYPYDLEGDMVCSMVRIYDIILDCTNQYEVMVLISKLCGQYEKPLISATLDHFQGKVVVTTSPHQRLIQPDRMADRKTGSLGFYYGILGSIMAGEAVKLISGFGNSSDAKILKIDFRQTKFSVEEPE